MKKHWKMWAKFVGVICVLALMASACTSAGPPEKGEKKIKLGIALDLTGAIATSGAPLSWGAFDYLTYVNDELGGIEYSTPEGEKAKVKLDMIWEDNAYSMPKTISIYKRFVAAGVDAIANFGSTPGEAITAMTSRDKMFVWGYYASSSPVNMGSKPNYYVPYFGNMAEQVGVVLKWFLEEKWPKHQDYGKRKPRAGFLMVDLPSLRPAGDPKAVEAYEAMGCNWVGSEWLSPAPTDVTIELTRMKKKKADIICTYHVLGGITVIAKDAKRIGIDNTKTIMVAPDWGFDEDLPRLAGDAVENYYGWRCTVNPDEESEGTRLAKKIAPMYGHWRPVCTYVSGVQAGTVIAETIRQALEDVGGDVNKLTGKVFMDAFAKIKKFDPMGLTAPISVNPKWRIMNPWVQISKINNGKIVRESARWYSYEEDAPVKGIMPTVEYP